jgi:hypothetical protein
MKKDTLVYAYKGIIGIKSAQDCEGLVNDPNDYNGMLYIINAENVKFSADAIELLKKIPCGKDSIGDVMSYKVTTDNMTLFGFKGGPVRVIGRIRPANPKELEKIKREKKKEDKESDEPVFFNTYGDSNFRPELLKPTEGIEPDKSFINYVNKLEAEGNLEKYVIA